MWTIKADKSEICRVGHQVGELGKSQCGSSSVKVVCWLSSFLLREASLRTIKTFN